MFLTTVKNMYSEVFTVSDQRLPKAIRESHYLKTEIKARRVKII